MLRTIAGVWFVFMGLLELGVVFLVLATGESRTEKVLVCLGVLIYLDAALGRSALLYSLAESDMASARRFMLLSELLKDPKHGEYVKFHTEARDDFERGKWKMMVSWGVKLVAAGIALIALLAAAFR